VPKEVEEEIKQHTGSYGKAKLILQQSKYFIEAEHCIMEQIKRIPIVEFAIAKAVER
jgi:hypothetical protein